MKLMGQFIFLFFLFFLPLIFCPFLFNAYELTKVIFFRVVVELMVGLFWVGILAGLVASFNRQKRNLIGFSVLLYGAWLFLTSWGGEYWWRSFLGNYFRQQGFFTFLHFIFFFFLVILISGKIKKKHLAAAISGGAFAASLYALYQSIDFLKIGDYFPDVAGSFGHPNFLGGFLVITLPFSFYLVRKQKIFAFFLLAQALAIFFSGSRMAIFLFLALICFYLSWFLRKKWLFPLLIAILVFGALPFAQETSRFENRGKIWQKGAEAFRQRPVFGWGLENFEDAFRSVLIPEKDIVLRDLRVDKAHNEFLEILVASGIVGLGLYLFILVSSFKVLWKKLKTAKNKDWWLAVFLSLCLFVLRSQVNPLSVAENVFFWLLIGLIAGSVVPKRKMQIKYPKGLFLIVALSLIFLIAFNFRSFMADCFFKKGVEAERAGQAEAGDYFQKARQIFPWEEVYQIKDKEYNL